MSDATPFAFGKLIPGFDFLQKLATGGGASSASGLAHWVAPTVNVEELEQRITELKAVQFWLEQNLLALKATIQALEVQKMTLATLRGMNLNVAEVARAFTLPTVEDTPAGPAAPSRSEGWPYAAAPASTPAAPAAAADPAPADEAPAPPAPRKAAKTPRKPAAEPKPAPASAAASGVADAMQWWGALTQQFQQIAGETLRQAARAVPADAPPAAPSTAPEADAGEAVPTKKAAAVKRPRAAAKKAKPRKAAAKKKPRTGGGAKPAAAGWPLPMPFKLPRS